MLSVNSISKALARRCRSMSGLPQTSNCSSASYGACHVASCVASLLPCLLPSVWLLCCLRRSFSFAFSPDFSSGGLPSSYHAVRGVMAKYSIFYSSQEKKILSASRIPPTLPALALAPRKASQQALKASKMEPRRAKIHPRGGQHGSRRPPEASWAPGGPQVATKAALRPLLGGSWGALGAVLGSLGPLPGPPGPLPGRSWLPGGHFFEVSGKLF